MSIWREREVKFKPINKAAALICRKARPEHMPPPEPEQQGPYLTDTQRAVIEYRATQSEKLKAIEAEIAESEQRKAAARAAQNPPKQKPVTLKMSVVAGRFARLMVKLAKKQGRAAPTGEQIQKAWLALPQPKTISKHHESN